MKQELENNIAKLNQLIGGFSYIETEDKSIILTHEGYSPINILPVVNGTLDCITSLTSLYIIEYWDAWAAAQIDEPTEHIPQHLIW